MKKIIFASFFLFFILTLAARPQPIAAAGSTTTTQNGEVKVVNVDGVMYLTTETNEITGTQAERNSRFSIVAPPSYAQNFGQLMSFIMRLVLAVSALLVFVYLIWGAIDWITSGGDKGKTEQARQKIVSAVVGLIIVSSSYAILNLALGFLGFGSLESALNSVGTIQGPPPASPTTDLGILIPATPSGTPK